MTGRPRPSGDSRSLCQCHSLALSPTPRRRPPKDSSSAPTTPHNPTCQDDHHNTNANKRRRAHARPARDVSLLSDALNWRRPRTALSGLGQRPAPLEQEVVVREVLSDTIPITGELPIFPPSDHNKPRLTAARCVGIVIQLQPQRPHPRLGCILFDGHPLRGHSGHLAAHRHARHGPHTHPNGPALVGLRPGVQRPVAEGVRVDILACRDGHPRVPGESRARQPDQPTHHEYYTRYQPQAVAPRVERTPCT